MRNVRRGGGGRGGGGPDRRIWTTVGLCLILRLSPEVYLKF